MASYSTDKIRNIVLLGHSGCGKTSLAEAMLFNSGAINRMGKVEDGNTVSDYDEEEISRTMSINLSVLPCEWKGHKINVIDVPGYADFQGEMLNGLHVADTAVIVIDGSAGVEVGTQLTWQMARRLGKPIVIFLNKMDRSNASFRRVVEQLRNTFDTTFVPMEMPIRNGEKFVGVVDLITKEAHTGTGKASQPPAEMADEIEEFRLQVIEYGAEGDDELMMKYFDGEELTEEEIAHGIRAGLRSGRIVPVFCGSAADNVAVRGFMNHILDAFPDPASVEVAAKTKGGGTESLKGDPSGPLAAQVFKTINDQYGRVSLIRVWSGTLKGDSRAVNCRTDHEERIAGLFSPRGKEQPHITEGAAGDIVGVVKLGDT
ncbi:MAG TPA: GTP-binding protein, partial [Anaerolineae bacterium]|nr:GTP-binding protein [Anaerolineae bacterium]